MYSQKEAFGSKKKVVAVDANRQMVIKRTLAAMTLLGSANVPAFASESEQAAALYNSAKMWVPLNFNDDAVWYVDPQSSYKVNENEWDVNITALNNSNQYFPNDTKTYRINCQNLDILPNIGWRINGVLKENRGPLGVRSTKDSRFKASPGQVIWTAKDYVCGISNSGSRYGWLNSGFRDGKIRGAIDQYWIKENIVYISEKNSNMRLIKILISFVGGSQYVFRDIYFNCDNRQFMEAENAVVKFDWKIAPSISFFDLLTEKMCSGQSKFISYQTTSFTMPAPMPKGITSEQPEALSDINGAKQTCADLGFKPGTEKFGNCVLKVSR